ncbi:MAG: hypothetical protein ACTSP4_00620 [Candidatus Hodarchaeales archaeon]
MKYPKFEAHFKIHGYILSLTEGVKNCLLLKHGRGTYEIEIPANLINQLKLIPVEKIKIYVEGRIYSRQKKISLCAQKIIYKNRAISKEYSFTTDRPKVITQAKYD